MYIRIHLFCLLEFTGCGDPPAIPNWTVTHNSQNEGAVAIYTLDPCQEGFVQCLNRTITSRCRASGEWDSVNTTGLCQPACVRGKIFKGTSTTYWTF